jgi:hypothetical protein
LSHPNELSFAIPNEVRNLLSADTTDSSRPKAAKWESFWVEPSCEASTSSLYAVSNLDNPKLMLVNPREGAASILSISRCEFRDRQNRFRKCIRGCIRPS